MKINNGILKDNTTELIIRLPHSLKKVESLNDVIDIHTPETSELFYDKQFRYSYDGETYSEWMPLENVYVRMIEKCEELFLEFKYRLVGKVTKEMNLTDISFNITYYSEAFNLPKMTHCQAVCQEWKMVCPNTYDIYQLDRMNCFQEALNIKVNNMYGHTGTYWRCVPDESSEDIIFKEYTLYECLPSEELKVILPENETPQNDIQFTQYEMDFMDMPFEIQIIKSEWARVFGKDSAPSRRDILYLPILDRLYQVDSAYLHKEGNSNSGQYYRVNIVKYEEEVITYKSDEVEGELDDLVVSYDDLMGEKKEEEFAEIVKEDNLEERIQGKQDKTIEEIDPRIKFEKLDLKHNWTLISDTGYNMSDISSDEIAVKYTKELNTNVLSATIWFNTEGNIKNSLFSYADGVLTVFGKEFGVQLDNDKWYGIYIGLSLKFKQLTVNIYEIPTFNKKQNVERKGMNLTEVYSKVIVLTDSVELSQQFALYGGKYRITNIRVFKQLIPDKLRMKVLNQRILGDAHKVLIMDNCLKQKIYDIDE